MKSVEGKKMLDKIMKLTDDFKRRTDKLRKHSITKATLVGETREALPGCGHSGDVAVREIERRARVSPSRMRLWPLATYREMLFIK